MCHDGLQMKHIKFCAKWMNGLGKDKFEKYIFPKMKNAIERRYQGIDSSSHCSRVISERLNLIIIAPPSVCREWVGFENILPTVDSSITVFENQF